MSPTDLIFFLAPAAVCIFVLLFVISRFVSSRLATRSMDVKSTGTWAVITSPTEGLGYSFTLALAQKGLNIVLLCQKEKEDPRELVKEIKKTCNVKTKTFQVDFSDDAATYEKYLQGTGIPQLEVGVLVNGVGMTEKCFADRDRANFIRGVSACNQASTKALTSLILPQMVDRKKGVVVNLSARTAWLDPFVVDYVFIATKEFVRSFTGNLKKEVEGTGVVVQALIPGYIPYLNSWIRPTDAQYVQSSIANLGVQSVTGGYWFHDLLLAIQHYDRILGSYGRDAIANNVLHKLT